MLKPGYIHAFPCAKTASVFNVSKYVTGGDVSERLRRYHNYWTSGLSIDPREQGW